MARYVFTVVLIPTPHLYEPASPRACRLLLSIPHDASTVGFLPVLYRSYIRYSVLLLVLFSTDRGLHNCRVIDACATDAPWRTTLTGYTRAMSASARRHANVPGHHANAAGPHAHAIGPHAHAAPISQARQPYLGILAMARNECPSFKEWLAHHRAQGTPKVPCCKEQTIPTCTLDHA